MTEQEWTEKYEPLPHPEGECHGFEVDGECCLIEPSETHILSEIEPNRIWSLVEDDLGNMIVHAGMLRVNVIGYLHTRSPWVTGDEHTESDEEDDWDDFDDDDYDDE